MILAMTTKEKIIKQALILFSENVYDGLMRLGADICLRTIEKIIASDGHPDAMSQQEMITSGEQLKSAPKIFKETCRIDWTKPAKQV